MKTTGDLSLEERKDLVRFVVANWTKMTTEQIAKVQDVKPHVIAAIVTRVRKMGVELPRKIFSSVYTEDFINELKDTLKRS